MKYFIALQVLFCSLPLISCHECNKNNDQIFITKESFKEVFSNKFLKDDTIQWFKVRIKDLKNDFNELDSIDLSNYIESAPQLSEFYVVDQAKFNFEKKVFKLGAKDSLLIKPNFRYTKMLSTCYLGNIDSIINNDRYKTKNEKIAYEIKIEIPTSKIGDHIIEGMYELERLDDTKELVPFKFEYEVIK